MPILPSSPTVAAIYSAYELEEGLRPPRTHLGGSEIGRECERELWLGFRWALPRQFPGRMLRLFRSGHLEEPRVIADLRRIGCEVLDRDPATNQQWSWSLHNGHYSGSADGVVLGLLEAPKTYHLLEVKTHNLKSFEKLLQLGVAKHKPEHYAQMQSYLYGLGLKRAAYFAVCKDDDRIELERVYPDKTLAKQLALKAARVIFAARPGERISLDPNSWGLCKFCDFRSLCHSDLTPAAVFPRRNCRTCLHAMPVAGNGREAPWRCSLMQTEISTEQQLSCGPCDGLRHRFVPDLVQGEQIDVRGEDAIVYQLQAHPLGQEAMEWIDVGQPV